MPVAHEIMTAREVDALLGFPRGRAGKLARAGSIPHYILPKGEIRFRRADIDCWLDECRVCGTAKVDPEAISASD